MWRNKNPIRMICPDCNGNGYIGSANKPSEQEDCKLCKNQGEVDINEKMLDKLREKGM